jgi:hypothetical protein
MRKLLVCVVGALLVSSPALAEEALDSGGGGMVPGLGLRIGVDVLGALPVGDFSDIAGAGLGGLARVEFDIGPIALTGRAGYVHHFEETVRIPATDTTAGRDVASTVGEIPLLVGAKLLVPGGLYAAAEVGLVRTLVDEGVRDAPGNIRDAIGGLDPDNLNGFNPAATVGVGLRLGGIDLRGGIHSLDLGDIDKTLELVVSLGFNFISL